MSTQKLSLQQILGPSGLCRLPEVVPPLPEARGKMLAPAFLSSFVSLILLLVFPSLQFLASILPSRPPCPRQVRRLRPLRRPHCLRGRPEVLETQQQLLAATQGTASLSLATSTSSLSRAFLQTGRKFRTFTLCMARPPPSTEGSSGSWAAAPGTTGDVSISSIRSMISSLLSSYDHTITDKVQAYR